MKRFGLVGAVVIAIGAAALLSIHRPGGTPVNGDVLVNDAAWPAAMVALPDGGLLFGERLSGRIRRVDASGRLIGPALARVAVSTTGQRGLLGLAAEADRIFASWTRPNGRLVVGRVSPPPARIVWEGPRSSARANGGRLAFAPDGDLVIGVGDLEQPSRVPSSSTPNGKVLKLDPSGPRTQQPRVVSSGWNNPFAFAFTPSGALWVADNAPGSESERLARGDLGGRPSLITELPKDTVPAGLAALSDDRLVMCGFASRVLQVYRIGPSGRASSSGAALAENCSIGVVRLGDGRLAYANENTILTVAAHPETPKGPWGEHRASYSTTRLDGGLDVVEIHLVDGRLQWPVARALFIHDETTSSRPASTTCSVPQGGDPGTLRSGRRKPTRWAQRWVKSAGAECLDLLLITATSPQRTSAHLCRALQTSEASSRPESQDPGSLESSCQ